jgi:hypothetical protein
VLFATGDDGLFSPSAPLSSPYPRALVLLARDARATRIVLCALSPRSHTHVRVTRVQGVRVREREMHRLLICAFSLSLEIYISDRYLSHRGWLLPSKVRGQFPCCLSVCHSSTHSLSSQHTCIRITHIHTRIMRILIHATRTFTHTQHARSHTRSIHTRAAHTHTYPCSITHADTQ